MRYWEDFAVGEKIALGPRTVTEAEIIEFARRYDPQPFHVDPAAAGRSLFGGVIASGWHTCALLMRMTVDAMQNEAAAGSPGVDSCRWRGPVRPGDTLTGHSEVMETWPSRSKPLGFVRRRSELVNQRGEPVLTLTGIAMYRRRPEPAP